MSSDTILNGYNIPLIIDIFGNIPDVLFKTIIGNVYYSIGLYKFTTQV